MSTSSKPQLIGISGTFASGKDTLANRLAKDFGFTHVSSPDILREIAQEERGSIERPVLQEVATKLRREHGADVLVQRALQTPLPLVVTGMRSMGEAQAIKDAGGVMVFVDAPVEMRYERMKSRVRDAEALLSLEGFVAGEQKEWYAGDGDGDFNLRDIKATADIVIENALDLEGFLDSAYRSLHLR